MGLLASCAASNEDCNPIPMLLAAEKALTSDERANTRPYIGDIVGEVPPSPYTHVTEQLSSIMDHLTDVFCMWVRNPNYAVGDCFMRGIVSCLQEIKPDTVDPALTALSGEMPELGPLTTWDELDNLLRGKHNDGYKMFVANVLFNNSLTTHLTRIFHGCLKRQMSSVTYPCVLYGFQLRFRTITWPLSALLRWRLRMHTDLGLIWRKLHEQLWNSWN